MKAQTEIKNATKRNMGKKFTLKKSESIKSLAKIKSSNSRQIISQIYMNIGEVPPSEQKVDYKIFPLTQIYG